MIPDTPCADVVLGTGRFRSSFRTGLTPVRARTRLTSSLGVEGRDGVLIPNAREEDLAEEDTTTGATILGEDCLETDFVSADFLTTMFGCVSSSSSDTVSAIIEDGSDRIDFIMSEGAIATE